jgi:orotidine-5'-phosphate decarboxylase
MIEAAAKRVQQENTGLTLLAVTVLTSMDAEDLEAVGVAAEPSHQVDRLARLATQAGAPGLVCSPLEVSRLRAELGPSVVLVTPGIRPGDGAAGADDQKRTGTPTSAIQDGASCLVVGRPIRDASDPRQAAARLRDEIAQALASR